MDGIPNRDITYFARTNFRGTDRIFGIKRKDRRQHTYVLGKSGTGKSVVLENMIIQNIKQGEGLCVVDPHGELVEKIMEMIPKERIKDVIYFNPADTEYNIGFNPLQLDDPKYRDLVAAGLMGIFTKIWANAWSSRMEYILQNSILALLDVPGTTLLGIPRLLVDKDYRQYVISNIKDPVIKNFWIHEYEAWRDQFRNEAIQPIQNKVGQFLSSAMVRNIVGQAKSTINIFDIMNEQKIFLVNVSKGRIGEDNSALLGGMLITKLQLAAMERVRIPEAERKDFYLYVDEFQNFVTDSFASILSEARKYRLCLTIAHQYISQLETSSGSAVRDAVFGNVGTMIIFRVGADDADALEKEFEPEFTVEDFVNLPNYHIYLKLMVDGVTSRPFSAKTLPPIAVDVSEETKKEIIDVSRSLYTRKREDVERDITRWSTSVPGQQNDEGENTAGKFKAECTNCNKQIYVPFEPEPGRPIYCKDCLFKIKTGEIVAQSGFRPPREKRENVSYDALAAIGIEFNAPATSSPKKYSPPQRDVQENQPKHDSFKRNDNARDIERKPRIDIPKKESIATALHSTLSALGIGENKPKEERKEIIQKNPPIQKPPEKKDSMSLNSLKEMTPIATQKTLNPKQDRGASSEHLSSLKETILNAIAQKKTEPEVLIEEKPVFKKDERVELENGHSTTQSAPTDPPPSSKDEQFKIKEVPEEILENIFKE